MMSLGKETQENLKKTETARPVVVRKARANPVKVLLRWVYWLVLIGVISAVVVTSVFSAMSMYKGLN